MFEKVNPSHPDKIADRIAGAIVDYAYTQDQNPQIAVEVLIGHGKCTIIAETSVLIPILFISDTVNRIAGCEVDTTYIEAPQDKHLSCNQANGIKCGDNGIFKGMPVTEEQRTLTKFVNNLYTALPYDGKFIYSKADKKVIACVSHCDAKSFKSLKDYIINPLGYWTGGIDVDTGATNRKLGSDMGDSVTGGGLHGKDLSKADVSVNIYAWLKAQETNKPVELYCAIGDALIDDKPYSEIVEIARNYINTIGGFEKFAEYGLINPF